MSFRPLALLDRWMESTSRDIAQHSSRRSFVTRVGSSLVGMAAIPLLPVARAEGEPPAGAAADAPALKPETGTGQSVAADPGDPTSCDYWRYCAMDGFMCSCCGGSATTCPPGTEMSSVTWIGTCLNPGDNKHYIISYNDCCGRTSCGTGLCVRNERDRPIYRQFSANDINWCVGTSAVSYHCTVALVVGVSPEASH